MTINKLEDLRQRKEKILLGGGEKRIASQHEKGKLTARERISLLFDEGTFVELDAFIKHRCVNFGMEKVDAPGEGVVTGYGQVDGRLVYAYAQDFTVVGGSLGEMHAKKICKVQDMALKMGAPIIGLNDSGGARIQEGVDALSGYGHIFYRNTISSGVIPQITAIMGPCAGGAVYSPALTDFIFMVDKTSQMFITGPQVIKTVTGEEVSAEELGGAMTHNKISGVAHFVSANDEACIAEIRRLISFLPSNNMETSPIFETDDDINKILPELDEIVPENPNKPYDMKNIIQHIADDGDFMEVQQYYAQNMITGYIRINGQTVGVIANQPKVLAGCLDINASDKAGRFIRTCDCFNIPVLNIVDVPGFLPGTTQEYGGIIRHGAKMLYAYSEATVPKITLIVRKAYGGAYIGMCNKELGSDIVLAWPTAEIAVMGPEGAANIIFKNDISNSDDPQTTRAEKIADYKSEFATPYKAAERGFVDDVIEPSSTRPRLVDALNMLASKQETRPPKKHGNVPL
ncbi:acyl-CoA carboxylase subunit beta [Alkaliphilus peptidifermentans]|uniref:Methylmalonyl-CoA decarboxylase alpha subunit n=1 Tax=Alkaliphilus peptidifermentans DSM 18978 TaxID=1120976 RepID=A0A1G5KIF6_9FIRM|nr:carboxyl transferase domain-containing protein [Alkaliphilus peptidifermentans]SCY99729.1 methylmalonyl-CoA decarboxylase alpha subunit [Alkaliphilus peptidifermentans DSM 18978]